MCMYKIYMYVHVQDTRACACIAAARWDKLECVLYRSWVYFSLSMKTKRKYSIENTFCRGRQRKYHIENSF
jgi:hypothetical protein